MASIQNESRKLVDILVETSKTNVGVFPFKDLQLYFMNTVVLIGFGRRFSSKDDPTFLDVSSTIDEGLTLTGVEYDLANYLPIFSIHDYFKGAQKTLIRYLAERRDPVFHNLIKEAYHADGPNLVKYLEENGYDLSEEEKIVTFSKL